MNIINVVNKKLIVEKLGKDSGFIKINIDAINVIYIVKNDNQNLETPMWEIYIITDFDDNIMIYNSDNEFIAKNEFKKLTSKLKKADDNFKSYYSKCINMNKVISVGWHKVPFKYMACVDFKNRSFKFRTFSEEFDKIIEDWSKVEKLSN